MRRLSSKFKGALLSISFDLISFGNSLIELEVPNMIVDVVRNRLVLILLILVPLFTCYDIIYAEIVEISTAYNFPTVSCYLCLFVVLDTPQYRLYSC